MMIKTLCVFIADRAEFIEFDIVTIAPHATVANHRGGLISQ